MPVDNPRDLSDEERELVIDFRRCTTRRREAVRRFTFKLSRLEKPLPAIEDRITNVLIFRRRKDD